MSVKLSQFTGYEPHSIHIGGVVASRKPAVIRTVLGSCISVCLRDPVARAGGMNHFMLPDGGSEGGSSTRYGIHAMELLINQCMKRGADRLKLEAKVFGGGHVLKMRESEDNVPKRNIRFVLEFLEYEGIPIVKRDMGGYAAREIFFFTDTGRTLLRRLTSTGTDRNEFDELEREEMALRRKRVVEAEEDDSNITLF